MTSTLFVFVLSVFVLIHTNTGQFVDLEKDCPLPCVCSGSVMNCNDQALLDWPTDKMPTENKDIFQLYIRDNFLVALPVIPLKFNLPALEMVDISGNQIPCQTLGCLKSDGVKVFSDCPYGFMEQCTEVCCDSPDNIPSPRVLTPSTEEVISSKSLLLTTTSPESQSLTTAYPKIATNHPALERTILSASPTWIESTSETSKSTRGAPIVSTSSTDTVTKTHSTKMDIAFYITLAFLVIAIIIVTFLARKLAGSNTCDGRSRFYAPQQSTGLNQTECTISSLNTLGNENVEEFRLEEFVASTPSRPQQSELPINPNSEGTGEVLRAEEIAGQTANESATGSRKTERHSGSNEQTQVTTEPSKTAGGKKAGKTLKEAEEKREESERLRSNPPQLRNRF